MTNEEAIKSMRNLDDVISITESEHESVKTAISALEHNSLLVEHISNLQNENTDFFNKLVESEKENTKLKDEIEQLKNEFDLYYKLYLASIDAREILTECVEQLKEELEQSVKLPCKVGDMVYRVNGKIIPMTIDSILIKHRCENVLIRIDCIENEFKGEFSYICDNITNDIGKKVFLTQEEAEQSLKAAQP